MLSSTLNHYASSEAPMLNGQLAFAWPSVIPADRKQVTREGTPRGVRMKV
jgi:hypothetical protein